MINNNNKSLLNIYLFIMMQVQGRGVAHPALTQQELKNKLLKKTFLTSLSCLMIMQTQVGVHLFFRRISVFFFKII